MGPAQAGGGLFFGGVNLARYQVSGSREAAGGEAVGQVTCRFHASLKHKDDGQTKFIKPNSQIQDIIIKYWASIGSIHREQG